MDSKVKRRSSESKTPGNEAPIVVTPRAMVRVAQQITRLLRSKS
jgi:Rad3-related DNA helicase